MDFAKKRTDWAKGLSEGATENLPTPRPVAPIRLGGAGRRRVLSLPIDLVEPPTVGEIIDTSALVEAFVDADERAFVRERAAGTRLRDVGEQLGWTQRRVHAVRMRVRRASSQVRARIEASSLRRGGSLRLIHREFIAGRPVWELDHLSEEFAEIMAAERPKTFFAKNVQK